MTAPIPEDEGDTNARMAADHQYGVVRIEFDQPMRWIALEPEKAIEFAAAIIDKATELMSNPTRRAVQHDLCDGNHGEPSCDDPECWLK